MNGQYPPVDELDVIDADFLEERLRVLEEVEHKDVTLFVTDAQNRLAAIGTAAVRQTSGRVSHIGQHVTSHERCHRLR